MDQTMELALRVEDRNKLGQPKYRNGPNDFSYKPASNPTHKMNSYPYFNPNSNLPQSNKPTGEIRRLSDKEWQSRKEKGLCFRCDEKWVIGHKCKKKELSVLVAQEEEEMEELVRGEIAGEDEG